MSSVAMSIRDYILKAGLQPSSQTGAVNQSKSGFGDMLAAALRSSDISAETPVGKDITNYLANPVVAQRGRRSMLSSGDAAGFETSLPDCQDMPTSGDTPQVADERPRLTSGPAVESQKPETASRVSSSTPRNQIEDSIARAAARYDLSPEILRAVIQAESSFRVHAVSPAGAQGLMQLMPATARELGVTDPFDIAQNIDGGARYLRQMLDMFDGDLRQALAAYNAGPGTVRRFDGNVPYSETRNYIARVLASLDGSVEYQL